jgi:hypothetical protein
MVEEDYAGAAHACFDEPQAVRAGLFALAAPVRAASHAIAFHDLGTAAWVGRTDALLPSWKAKCQGARLGSMTARAAGLPLRSSGGFPRDSPTDDRRQPRALGSRWPSRSIARRMTR